MIEDEICEHEVGFMQICGKPAAGAQLAYLCSEHLKTGWETKEEYRERLILELRKNYLPNLGHVWTIGDVIETIRQMSIELQEAGDDK